MPPTPRKRNAQGDESAPLTPHAEPAVNSLSGTVQNDETLPGQGPASNQAEKRGTHLRVLAPFVHYRVEYADPFLPAGENTRMIEQTAYQGQLIDVEALPDGEADRLLRLKANPAHGDVEEVSGANAVVLPPQTQRMVGVGTGAQTAESLALQAAVERTRRQLASQIREGDPEYEVASSEPVPAGSRYAVPAGPGGYDDEAIRAAGAPDAYTGSAND